MCKWSKWGDTRIDPCMRDLIKYLNNAKIETLACCCGHGKYPKTIVIKLHPGCGEPGQMELLSMTRIPRNKRFYKRDKNGVYFIPEVSNGKP